METFPEMILSKRGAVAAKASSVQSSPVFNSYIKTYKNLFHPRHNPKGIVNMAFAENSLMEEEMCGRLNQGDASNFQEQHLHYCNITGTKEFKEAVANFLTRHFHPCKPILPSSVVGLNGATACLDALVHALCDPGDVIITPVPVYNCIITDFRDLAGACPEFLVLSKDESDGESFKLRPEDLERRITELRSEQRKVRAFILLNPQNPLGQVYSPDLILSLLQVCARQQIHAIIDEVYAMSVFSEKTEFHSGMTLDLPDPQRTHFVWALSKDFGASGLRVGVVVTECESLLAYLTTAAFVLSIPHILQHTAAVLLNDTAWCDEFYLPTNKRRLREAYERARERLEGMGAVVREASCGVFILANVQPFLPQLTHDEDLALHKELLQAGVYTMPGLIFCYPEPGWIRIIFAVKPEALEEGLNRLETVLKGRKKTTLTCVDL